jgi:hypothetical protein
MSSDASSKGQADPMVEVQKEKLFEKSEDKKKNRLQEEEGDLETTDDEMSFQEWKAWRKKKKL